MKKLFLLGALISFYFAGSAQVSKDSLNVLKQQKEIADLKSKISATQIKLAKESNNLNQLQNDYAIDQQKAYDAANTSNALSTSAGDVSSAKKAVNAANAAAKMNKKVADDQNKILKSQKKINDYNSDIIKYNNKLQTMEYKLNGYRSVQPTPPAPDAPPQY